MYFTKIFICFITIGKSDISPTMYPTIVPSLNLNNSNNLINIPINMPTSMSKKINKNLPPPTVHNIFAGIIFCLVMFFFISIFLYCCYKFWCVWDDILD